MEGPVAELVLPDEEFAGAGAGVLRTLAYRVPAASHVRTDTTGHVIAR